MALTSPRFDGSDVERIRTQVSVGLAARNLQSGIRWPAASCWKSPLAIIPMAGRATALWRAFPDRCRRPEGLRRPRTGQDTLKIAVVGDIDPATLGKLLDQTFGGLLPKAGLVPVAEVEAARPPQRAPSFRSTFRRPW
jgi:zinc protease